MPPLASRADIEYCRRLVQRHDLDGYLVSLFSPRAAREAVWAVRALNVEVVRAATGSEPAARLRLGFWRDSVQRMYSDAPDRTPIARCVHDAVQRHAISRTWLRRLVAERERSLAAAGFATVADVERYGERAYACLLHPHLEALGVRDMHADNAARAIGVATAIAVTSRSLPQLLAQRRCDLPADLVAAHNVDLDDLYAAPRSTPQLQAAVYDLATRAYTRLCGAAEVYAPAAPRAAFPALLAAVPVKHWLERLEAANFDVFDRRLQHRELALMWHLWRASRRRTWAVGAK
ncbi:hypothetical protein GGI15_003609 [Coemansia interrupta]|uniref:Phytoene synthase n=1 Tax=Coemansia interrupta TaxID=1126814 RepID=A0A9W8H8B8_9FUNG|nr:hypothetical protein GGI15_003609 [Coemansia interrupta]